MTRKVRLQDGALPKQLKSSQDPHQPMSVSKYQAANLRPDTFEKTSDAYMYDVVFAYFEKDKGFWDEWSVVDCMAAVPDKSQKQACRQCGRPYENLQEDVCQYCGNKREMGRAPIRVVMDREAMSELPRSYPPIPPGRQRPKSMPGLPGGYSVPLEAFTIKDAESLLERQRLFNDEKIDPRYQWLEDILEKYFERHPEARGRVTPMAKQKASSVRGFVSSLFTSKQETLPLPKGFGAEKGSGKEVISRNGLVSTYATEKLVTGPFRPALRDVSRQSTVEPGDDLDQQLEELLTRTDGKPVTGGE